MSAADCLETGKRFCRETALPYKSAFSFAVSSSMAFLSIRWNRISTSGSWKPPGTDCFSQRFVSPSHLETYSEEKGRKGASSTARFAMICTH